MDREAFCSFLQGLNTERLEKLLGRIEAYEGSFSAGSIEPGIGAILDCYDRFRQESRGMFDATGVTAGMRVVYRLLKQIDSPEMRQAAIIRIIPSLKWHSAVRELIRSSKGHEFISEEVETGLLSALCQRLLAESPAHLVKERDLWRLSNTAVRAFPDEKDRFLTQFEAYPLFIRMLRSALSQGHRHTGDNLYSETTHTLPWDDLIEIFGEEVLINRIKKLPTREALGDIEPLTATALELAKKYADGWRPNDFFECRPN